MYVIVIAGHKKGPRKNQAENDLTMRHWQLFYLHAY